MGTVRAGPCILGDPRRAGMKDRINAKIKFRKEFRPFALAVMEEYYGEYFETFWMTQNPYMLFTHRALRPAAVAAVVHAEIEDYLVEKE